MTFYTTVQYDEGVKRILDLQNPKRQPLSIAHQWELNDLMTAAAKYEDDRDKEAWEHQQEVEAMQDFEDRFLDSMER